MCHSGVTYRESGLPLSSLHPSRRTGKIPGGSPRASICNLDRGRDPCHEQTIRTFSCSPLIAAEARSHWIGQMVCRSWSTSASATVYTANTSLGTKRSSLLCLSNQVFGMVLLLPPAFMPGSPISCNCRWRPSAPYLLMSPGHVCNQRVSAGLQSPCFLCAPTASLSFI